MKVKGVEIPAMGRRPEDRAPTVGLSWVVLWAGFVGGFRGGVRGRHGSAEGLGPVHFALLVGLCA